MHRDQGAGDTPPPRRNNRWKLLGVGVLAASIFSSPFMGTLPPSLAASIGPPTDGVMILNNMTLPYGAVWLDGGLGGHLWVTDNVQGICRVDSAPAASPPWQKSNCNGTTKSGGQIVVGNPPAQPPNGTPPGAKYVYVADNGSKSVNVVRFVFNPASETLQSAQTMTVQNPTSVGGGAGGGRPVGLALAPNGSDLYVGYLKSGDVMKISGAQTATTTTPRVDKIGSTSDGRGVNALVLFRNDLYLAEVGGFGLSRIPDPSGISRPACSTTSQCTATTLKPQPSSFPGGLATDGTFIYIGDAPRAAPNSILRYDPLAGTTITWSDTVPTYTSTFDNQARTQYVAPFGLGLAPTGDLYVGDDATQGLPLPGQAAPATLQGHIWKVAAQANMLSVAAVTNTIADQTSPFYRKNSGSTAGGDQVSVDGTGFSTGPGATTINFGSNAAVNVTCGSSTNCTATTPAGSGSVDVRVAVAGRLSPTTTADQFIYVAPTPVTAIAISGVSNIPGFTSNVPTSTAASGVITGNTQILITGQGLATVDANNNVTATPTVTFGANQATGVACASATSCTAFSPAGTAGVVDVQATLGTDTSPASAADKFTYVTPTASLYAWGITAPKGGAIWLAGNQGGHWWSSDHAQGLCRQDPVPGTTLHAINFGVCGDDIIGSAGQAVYDPHANADGTHYVYVPDNAVKSTAVWRLTFNPVSESMVPDPATGSTATAMTPLADVRTLKPNGMALGPDGGLYVTDLTEANVRKITNPGGDPRTQAISIVAQTGDLRGANGTMGFIGNNLYISENRGTSFFDVTRCPLQNGPCGTVKIPMKVPAAGVFVAGTAVDAAHQLVYSSDSPGGSPATIYRYDASKDVYAPFLAGSLGANPTACPGCTVGSAAPILVSGGPLPTAGKPEATVYCALSCTRPWDFQNHPTQGGTAGFSFAFGLATDASGNLVITEDPTAGARSGHGSMWTVPFIP